MHWILILTTAWHMTRLNDNSAGVTVAMQEFNTEAACKYAGDVAVTQAKAVIMQVYPTANCVPKGK